MCRLIERLYVLIPLTAFRAWLLRVHIESCPECRREFEPEGDLRRLAASPEWTRTEESLWPGIRAGLRTKMAGSRFRRERFRPRVRWAVPAAVAGLLLALAGGVRLFRPARAPEDAARVSLVRAESNGRKASAFFFQTGVASYVWIAGEEHDEKE